jgi:hypothetical protein
MALNKTILKKLNEKTKGEPEIQDFLISIMQFESESRGWFEKEYVQSLEKYCKEDNSK